MSFNGKYCEQEYCTEWIGYHKQFCHKHEEEGGEEGEEEEKETKNKEEKATETDILLQNALYDSFANNYPKETCKEKSRIIRLMSDIEQDEISKTKLDISMIMNNMCDEEYENECYKMLEHRILLMKALRKYKEDQEWIANLLNVENKLITLKKQQVLESYRLSNSSKIAKKLTKYQMVLLELLQ
jgi:hypothetical protein